MTTLTVSVEMSDPQIFKVKEREVVKSHDSFDEKKLKPIAFILLARSFLFSASVSCLFFGQLTNDDVSVEKDVVVRQNRPSVRFMTGRAGVAASI